jgi:hypothetical protein
VQPVAQVQKVELKFRKYPSCVAPRVLVSRVYFFLLEHLFLIFVNLAAEFAPNFVLLKAWIEGLILRKIRLDFVVKFAFIVVVFVLDYATIAKIVPLMPKKLEKAAIK